MWGFDACRQLLQLLSSYQYVEMGESVVSEARFDKENYPR